MRARPLIPMPPIPTKWMRAGAGGSNAPCTSASACNVGTPKLLLQRVHSLTEAVAPVELVTEQPERRAAGREQDDVTRPRLAPCRCDRFCHPGEGSARRQTAAAQRRLQGRGRRTREEVDLRLMSCGGLHQWRGIESLVGATRQKVYLAPSPCQRLQCRHRCRRRRRRRVVDEGHAVELRDSLHSILYALE